MRHKNVLQDNIKWESDILVANSDERTVLKSVERGSLTFIQGRERKGKIEEILVVPGLSENLLLLRKFAERNFKILHTDEKIEIIDRETGIVFLKGNYESPFWKINLEIGSEEKKRKENTLS